MGFQPAAVAAEMARRTAGGFHEAADDRGREGMEK
jgi:hypothetical protein